MNFANCRERTLQRTRSGTCPFPAAVLAIVLLAKREITDICRYEVFAYVLAAHDGYKVIGLAGAKARVIGYFARPPMSSMPIVCRCHSIP